MPTPHNQATKDQIAQNMIMPGDPMRAKFIAENFLKDASCFNTLRGMLGYTGFYKGKKISVMGHGMGVPSIGIYSYELFNEYNVEKIIRVGSAGAISKDIKVNDIVIAMGACTNSNYAMQYNLPGTFAPIADYGLLSNVVKEAEKLKLSVNVGNILTSDSFYDDSGRTMEWLKMGVLAVEMETAALYMNSARLGKKALSILTISDEVYSSAALTGEEREKGFGNMIELALESIGE